MDLKCRFQLTKWRNEQLYYTCLVSTASITERNTLVSFNGVHQENKQDIDVEAVLFDQANVHFFPKGLFKVFPQIKVVSIFSCGLKEISAQNLIGLENLERLYLNSNHLTHLPTNLLKNMNQLKDLRFSSNRLELVSPDILSTKNSHLLDFVDFQDNKKINALFDSSLSTKINTLQKLKDEIRKKCKPPNEETDDRQAQQFKSIFLKNFHSLWKSGCFTDFVVVSGTKEFKVHKCVLATQSPVFAAIFKIDMEESKKNRMNILDFDEKSVEDFLNYLYSGEVTSETNAMELFALAGKYNIPDLKTITEATILDNLNDSNALEILTLGNLHGSEDMIQIAFSKFKLMFPNFHFQDGMKTNPCELSRLIGAKKLYQREILEAKKYHEQRLRQTRELFESEHEKNIMKAKKKYEAVTGMKP